MNFNNIANINGVEVNYEYWPKGDKWSYLCLNCLYKSRAADLGLLKKRCNRYFKTECFAVGCRAEAKYEIVVKDIPPIEQLKLLEK